MAKTTRKIKKVKKPRVSLKTKFKKAKTRSMAYFRKRRFKRSFRSNFRRPRFNNRRRSYNSLPRVPFVGRKGNKLIILLALIGGGMIFFKDALRPMIEKFKAKIKAS